MATQILDLSEFNGDQVTSYFKLTPEHKLERAAMHFMFRMLKEQIAADYPDKAKKYTEIAECAIGHIETRFDLYKEMAADFFYGDYIEKDALCLAVICGDYLPRLNDAYPREVHDPEEPTNHRNDGIDSETILCALNMFEDVKNLRENGKPVEEYGMCNESVFLAHICAFDWLCDVESGVEEIDDLDAFLEKDLANIRSFVRKDTEIGRQLDKYLDHMATLMAPIEALTAPRKAPVLTLVPKPANP
jgi:hypothetical protein